MFDPLFDFIREQYRTGSTIALHEPCFQGNEQKYLEECIQTRFVSSVGNFVDRFEQMVADYTGAKFAVATVNGTAALHVALLLAGILPDDEVITQPLTFVATCNAISYCGARPVFVDVDKETMGLSPEALRRFLETETTCNDRECINKRTGRRIGACVPMHTFGHPCQMDAITEICSRYGIPVVEDAAESLGSRYRGRHTGTFGIAGILSFNGNKIITTGGGGMIITNDASLAKKAKHLTTTAKVPHPYAYDHDMIGFNYRLPNINAALGCAQMEQLEEVIDKKRCLAADYASFCQQLGLNFVKEPPGSRSNYWLNTLIMKDRQERGLFLRTSHREGILARPAWRLMTKLKMYSKAQHDGAKNANWLADRLVNLPSSPAV